MDQTSKRVSEKNNAIVTMLFGMLLPMLEGFRHRRQHAEQNEQHPCMLAVVLFSAFVNVQSRAWLEHSKR
jgi:hypothetical protein